MGRGSGTVQETRKILRRLVAGSLSALLAAALAAPPAMAGSTKSTEPPLRHMSVDLSNTTALRDGAMEVMHRCVGCHSIQGTRFTALAEPLGLTDKEVERFLNLTTRRVPETIVSSMPQGLAEKFFHKAPPDLTVVAKRRGVDWLYTYLTSFYADPIRPTGANNVVFYNVAMPDVFAGLQGMQRPVMKEGWRYGQKARVAVGVHQVTAGAMTHRQFDAVARDIVSFLYLIAHPHQQERQALGPWILGLFGLLAIISYLLYKAYWKRVILSEERWYRKK